MKMYIYKFVDVDLDVEVTDAMVPTDIKLSKI